MQDISIRLCITESQDHRRYNLPLADEIAVIIPGDGSEVWDNRDIIVRKRDDGMPLRRVNDGHPSYACLHYVLLFPYGEDGWHWKLKRHQPDREDPKRLSQSRFYSFRLHPRPAEFSTSRVLDHPTCRSTMPAIHCRCMGSNRTKQAKLSVPQPKQTPCVTILWPRGCNQLG